MTAGWCIDVDTLLHVFFYYLCVMITALPRVSNCGLPARPIICSIVPRLRFFGHHPRHLVIKPYIIGFFFGIIHVINSLNHIELGVYVVYNYPNSEDDDDT